jgi:aquaporin Z
MKAAARGFQVEYAIEAALLGLFMIAACGFTVLLEHPASPVRHTLPDPVIRRMLMGLAMGSTAVTLIYSPWGKRSGAHMNPAVTLTFARLGKVAPRDAALYVGGQFVGGLAGVFVASLALGGLLTDRATNYAATLPGPPGLAVAFGAEALITFVLMSVILVVSNHARWARWTGLCAGLLVAIYITVEAPLSGMSMNPARTFGSVAFTRDWTALWIYFVAPPLGMLAAAEAYVRRRGPEAVFCAKLCHAEPCRFCEWRLAEGRKWNQSPSGVVPTPSPPAATHQGERSMRRRTWIIGLVVLGAIGWYLFRPELLFVKTTVNEELPAEVAAQTERAGASVASGALLTGQFRSLAHQTVGTAAVHELAGRRILRLTGFSTSNGPDVRVYLVAANDAADNESVTKAGFVELGKLKGTQGDQNYDIPADVDLQKYRAVTIWCRRFSVNFGTAPLTPAS